MINKLVKVFRRLFTPEPFPGQKKSRGKTIGDHYDIEYQVSEKQGAVYIGFPEKGEDERNPDFPENE